MANIQHKTLTGSKLHVAGYVQDTDPGAVGAGMLWIDTVEGTGKWVTKIRNADNLDWEIAGSGLGASGYSGYSGASGVSGYSGSAGVGVMSSYTQSFVDGDLSAGILFVGHGLNSRVAHVDVVDNNYVTILPDEITSTGSNSMDIDLSSYIPLTGTWGVRVSMGMLTTYNTAFTDGDLVAGLLTVQHDLNSRFIHTVLYNDSYKIVIPDSVTSIDANTSTINLLSFGTLTGTWRVRFSI